MKLIFGSGTSAVLLNDVLGFIVLEELDKVILYQLFCLCLLWTLFNPSLIQQSKVVCCILHSLFLVMMTSLSFSMSMTP
jgi:hypothetical protein